MGNGRPVVRHLVDDVLPSGDGGLFCFLIHCDLDFALAAMRATWHTDLPFPSIAGPTSIAVPGRRTKSKRDSATTAPFAPFSLRCPRATHHLATLST